MSQELERVYTINLGKVLLSPDNIRAKRAINMVREFARHHMKVEDIKIEESLAHHIWSRGIKHPPRKVRVRMTKTDEGFVLVEPFDEEIEKVKSEEKKSEVEEKKKIEAEETAQPKIEETIEKPKDTKTEKPKDTKTEKPKDTKTEKPKVPAPKAPKSEPPKKGKTEPKDKAKPKSTKPTAKKKPTKS